MNHVEIKGMLFSGINEQIIYLLQIQNTEMTQSSNKRK